MMSKLCVHLRSPRGATVVEYIIAVILVVMLIMGMGKLMGTTILDKFRQGGQTIDKIDAEKGYASADASDRAASGDGSSRGQADAQDKGASGSKSASGSKGASSGSSTKGKPKGSKDLSERPDMLPAAQKPKKEAGFNPIILLIVAFLIGTLIFVMYKGKRDS